MKLFWSFDTGIAAGKMQAYNNKVNFTPKKEGSYAESAT
jgi:hypothetical protein